MTTAELWDELCLALNAAKAADAAEAAEIARTGANADWEVRNAANVAWRRFRYLEAELFGFGKVAIIYGN